MLALYHSEYSSEHMMYVCMYVCVCVCGAKLSRTTRAYVTKRAEDMKCHDSGTLFVYTGSDEHAMVGLQPQLIIA